MGLMDKLKNLFTEEVEEEVEVKDEPIKKEMIQVEIPSPVQRRTEIEEIKPEPAPIEPKKEEFNFPFFDDEDFHEIEKPKPASKPKEEKRKRAEKKETREVYSPIKEEKKVFKPTPIISPVYGILDKNYQKEDIRSKHQRPRSYYNPKEATVDEIRNKAYGTLEDDIETTLFGKNHLMFDDIPKEEPESLEIKEEKNEEYTDSLIGERPRHSSNAEPDLTDLLEEELGKDNVKETPKDEKPHKISDSELFSMIDSMYQKGDK